MWVNDALISTAPQELFDHVVEQLVAQGHKASQANEDYDLGVQCLYRTPEGLRCALGHCFTDAMHARVDADAGALGKLLQEQPLTGLSLHLKGFLGSLQKAHDRSASRPAWVSMMQEVADRYTLDPQKLIELATPVWAAMENW